MANRDIVAIVLAEQIKDLKEQLYAKNEEIAMLKTMLKDKKGEAAVAACVPGAAAAKATKKKAIEPPSSKKSSKKMKSDGTPDLRTTEGKALAAAMQLAAVSSSSEMDESGDDLKDEKADGEKADEKADDAPNAVVAAWVPGGGGGQAGAPVHEGVGEFEM